MDAILRTDFRTLADCLGSGACCKCTHSLPRAHPCTRAPVRRGRGAPSCSRRTASGNLTVTAGYRGTSISIACWPTYPHPLPRLAFPCCAGPSLSPQTPAALLSKTQANRRPDEPALLVDFSRCQPCPPAELCRTIPAFNFRSCGLGRRGCVPGAHHSYQLCFLKVCILRCPSSWHTRRPLKRTYCFTQHFVDLSSFVACLRTLAWYVSRCAGSTKRVNIVGAAGTGKSACLASIAASWADGIAFTAFKATVCVPLSSLLLLPASISLDNNATSVDLAFPVSLVCSHLFHFPGLQACLDGGGCVPKTRVEYN